MRELIVYDKNIKFLGKKGKKVNGIGAVTYYFTRLTRASMLPIEITAVEIGNRLFFFSPQLTQYRLRETEDKAYYMNSIVFDKNAVLDEINAIEDAKTDNKTADVFKEVFGIDLSGIKDYEGLIFDRIIRTESFKIANTDLVADGYTFVFTDIASRKAKFAFFAGNLRNMRFDEYVEVLNDYGASNILNDIVITQTKQKTKIKNNTPFYIQIQPYLTTYNKTPLKYGDVEFQRVKEPGAEIVLGPYQEFELQNEEPSFDIEYTLLDNAIAKMYYNEPFKRTDEEYQTQKKLIRSRPFEFELKKVGLEPNTTDDIDDFFIVTGIDTLDKLDKAPYSIIHLDSNAIFTKKTDFGPLTIDTAKLSNKVTPEGMKEGLIKGFANTMLLNIDKEQYAFDYSFKGTDTIITEIAMKNVFNNVTSTYMPVLSIKTATFADYRDFEEQNTKIKYEKVVYSMKYEALPYLMKSDVFTRGLVMVDIQEISDISTRPMFGQYIFKSFVKELDDVIEEFMDRRKQAVHNYKFIDIPLEISSADLAELAPKSDIWSINATQETNDFTYKVKYHLADLGYEIALEEALKKLKAAVYVYTPVKNVIATNHFGVSLDKEWFFFGSNWYKAEEVLNPKITTYIDGVIKEYDLDETKHKFMYVKKVFYGYDNSMSEAAQYARSLAVCLGTGEPMPRDLESQNPAITYVMKHLLDNDRAYPSFEEITTYPAEYITKYIDKETINRYAFPNIFARDLERPFYPGIYSSARAAEFKRYMLNKALDTLNSIVTFKIQTSAFIAFDADFLFELVDLFKVSGYKILGIEDTSLAFDEAVKFKFNFGENVFIGGREYSHAMEIFINNERKFGLYYDIYTKASHIFIAERVNVLDYSFMVGMFDAMLLYNIDSIGEYVYDSPGVYKHYLLKDKVEAKYLYLPAPAKIESDCRLVGISINYINKAIYLDLIGDKTSSMTYDLGDEATIKLFAEIDEDEIVIHKNDQIFRVPMTTLQNLPAKSLTYNGILIKPHRTEIFLPLEYADKHLDRLSFAVDINSEPRYGNLAYSEAIWIDKDENTSYMFALGSKGLVYAVKTGASMSDFKVIYSLDEIFSGVTEKEDAPFNARILAVKGDE